MPLIKVGSWCEEKGEGVICVDKGPESHCKLNTSMGRAWAHPFWGLNSIGKSLTQLQQLNGEYTVFHIFTFTLHSHHWAAISFV